MPLLDDYTRFLLLQKIIIIICMINFLTAEEDLALINFLLTFNMSNEETEWRKDPLLP